MRGSCRRSGKDEAAEIMDRTKSITPPFNSAAQSDGPDRTQPPDAPSDREKEAARAEYHRQHATHLTPELRPPGTPSPRPMTRQELDAGFEAKWQAKHAAEERDQKGTSQAQDQPEAKREERDRATPHAEQGDRSKQQRSSVVEQNQGKAEERDSAGPGRGPVGERGSAKSAFTRASTDRTGQAPQDREPPGR